MSKPDIKDKVGGYEFTWADHKIKVDVSRVRQHRDDRITGWLMFTSMAASGIGLIHQTELNLKSSQSQKQLVNILTEKMDKPPWDDVIEQLRYYIIERVRQGEPVEIVSSSSADIAPPTYLIYPLLPENQPTILYGEPGAGKSRIANLLYICLALPWWNNPLGLIVPDKGVTPLILDWETDLNTTAYRIKALVEGMGLGEIPINYRRCLSRFSEDTEQIQMAIDKVKANCLIIDSLTAACGGKVMEIESAGEFFASVRKIGLTAFIIGQTQKDPELSKKSVLGAGIFEYYSRSIWEIKKAQTVGENEMHTALMHRKANESKLHKSLAYRFYFNEDHISVSTADMTKVAEFNRDVPLRRRILDDLKHGSKTAKEIAENIDGRAGTVSRYLTQMKEKGEVVSLSENKWGLATRE